MRTREFKPNEIAICQVDNHLDMVIVRDMVNSRGEQLYKVGHYNRETNGYGLYKYALSFDNALENFKNRIFTNVRNNFIFKQETEKNNFIICSNCQNTHNENELCRCNKFILERLLHLKKLLHINVLLEEDIQKIIDELT